MIEKISGLYQLGTIGEESAPFNKSIGGIIREMWPFLAVLIGVLLACTYIPGIVLWLPKLAGYIP